MKSHAIVMLVALVAHSHLGQVTNAAEELIGPPMAPSIAPLELECPPVELGSPLTLMQWSYGDGADGEVLPQALESDRPYFTKSASVVGRGSWQLEAGYTYGRESNDGDHTLHSFPEANVRMGVLAEWFEFRLGWTYLNDHDDSSGRDHSDSSDPYVGIKIALTPQEEMLPETAVLIDTNLPTSLERNDMEPGADFIYRWRLNDKWSMGGSSEFRRVSLHRRDAAARFAQSWIFERTVADLLTVYAEWAMVSVDTPPDPDTAQYIDGGLLYPVTDNIQFDASVGYGLDLLAVDYFCGVGVTIRR